MQATLHLLDSAAVMAALALLFGVVRRMAVALRWQHALLGAAFGLGAVVSMLQPVLSVGQMIVDCRSLFVGFAGAFLGIEGMLAALVVAASGRLMIGVSPAAFLGLAGLTISALAGGLWRVHFAAMKDVWAKFSILGLMISSALLTLFLVPEFRSTSWPVESVMGLTLFNVAGSLVLGAFLHREKSLADREHNALIAASTDPLTGVLNRRGFSARFALAEASTDARGSAFLLVDLDHFKSINDMHGHPFGDRVLRLVGDRIRRAVRPQDVVMRVGGEEFGVLLTDVDEPGAKLFAERLREHLAAPCTPAGRSDLTVTASIGGFCWPTGSQPLEAASEIADRALYAAKAQGRNRAVFLA